MAVYTEVSFELAQALFSTLSVGELTALKGCQGGIENTNYFASTDKGEYVLTLFERLTSDQLPYYLHLMKHLAEKGIPVPDPAINKAGEILLSLHGKPAAVVNRLDGHSQLAPGPQHCAETGAMLAKMHLAGANFDMHQRNLRGLAWWNETVPVVLPFLDASQAQLLQAELSYQNHVAAQANYAALPCGPIHADLFRDNVMFDGTRLTGFFDFYFAGHDTWLFDLAVTLNDWCIDLSSGLPDPELTEAMLTAYQSVRPLESYERQLLPAMLRGAALRFWLSRLWDYHLPRQASMLKAHDPSHFERILLARVHTNEIKQPALA
jgi:homoserine kinase type II